MSTVRNFPQAGSASDIIGAEVRSLMGRHQVNQTKMAEVLGVSQSQMSKRLRGVVPFDADELVTIARFFGVSVGSLFGETTIAPGPGEPEGEWSGRRDSNPQHSAWNDEDSTFELRLVA